MKKSEFMQHLENIINFHTNQETLWKLSEDIMQLIEDTGMTPPTYVPVEMFDEPNGFNIGVNEWEPEQGNQ